MALDLNQSIKNLTPYVGLSSPIRRRSRSLGSGHKGCFEQMSFEMFPECLNSKSKAVERLCIFGRYGALQILLLLFIISFGTWQISVGLAGLPLLVWLAC